MVEITKDEARQIKAVYPNAVTKTCRLKRNYRGHYYMCEDSRYVNLLSQIRRSRKVVYEYGMN